MRILVLAVVISFCMGCVNNPVSTTEVIDDRPRLTFDASALGKELSRYQLVIDGVNYGSITQYLKDESSLRIVPGNHVVDVQLDGQSIFSKTVYLGENTTRVVKVVAYEK
ncbi:MAG TPA: hypothetical protein VIC26_15920 [Marinagarivorans sp.]